VRPAQNRGVSEVAPCLRLFADMRRFTSAVLAAAETAADFAAFLHSNSPAAEVDEVDAFQSMEIEKRSMVTLPEGWSVSQLRAEQPVATYAMFKREIIGEIARALQLPYNIAALDSSSYNYSSGRLDWQVYSQTIRVQRDDLERGILDRLFRAWCDEASLVGLIPSGMPPIAEWTWTWTWDGREHVDPMKEANATESRLRTHTTTLAAEYARQGKSWEVELRQRAAEIALMKELDLFVDLQPETNYGGQLDEDGEPVPAGEK
jgi:capsid protein